MEISSLYKLPISKENEVLIPIIATGLGYVGDGDPKDFIIKHFNDFYDNLRIVTESSLNRHFGEIEKSTVESILNLYDSQVIKETTI